MDRGDLKSKYIGLRNRAISEIRDLKSYNVGRSRKPVSEEYRTSITLLVRRGSLRIVVNSLERYPCLQSKRIASTLEEAIESARTYFTLQ